MKTCIDAGFLVIHFDKEICGWGLLLSLHVRIYSNTYTPCIYNAFRGIVHAACVRRSIGQIVSRTEIWSGSNYKFIQSRPYAWYHGTNLALHLVLRFDSMICAAAKKCLPLQVVPFPVNPFLQLQTNDPTVLVHVAWAWQLAVPKRHSSTSTTE